MDDVKFIEKIIEKLECGQEIDTNEVVKVLRLAREHIVDSDKTKWEILPGIPIERITLQPEIW